MRRNNKKAASIMEYTTLIIIILGALLLMRQYIFQAMMGRWKETADSFGYGRQFDSTTAAVVENLFGCADGHQEGAKWCKTISAGGPPPHGNQCHTYGVVLEMLRCENGQMVSNGQCSVSVTSCPPPASGQCNSGCDSSYCKLCP